MNCIEINRILLLSAVMLFLTTSIAISQQDDDEPLPPPKRAGSTKIGGAGGFTQSWLFLNVDPINDVMRGNHMAEFRKRGLFMVGGQGYGYILLVANLRIGGMGMSGSMKSRTLSGNVVREVELSAGYGGVTVEYTVPIIPRLDVSVGMLVGGGGIDLKFNRSYSLAQRWDSTWGDFGDANGPGPAVGEYSGKLSGSFFVYQPALDVEYAVLRWLGVRMGVSYVGMSNPTWKRDDKFEVFGVPDDVTGKGWSVNTGIFIGTFVF